MGHYQQWRRYKELYSPLLKPGERRHKFGTITPDGYRMIPVNGKKRAEHRVVMEEHLGRTLLPEETVHHKRGKAENDIENLELWNTSHPAGQRVSDLIEWAEELLHQYASERLNV
jgi:hypothetical protein